MTRVTVELDDTIVDQLRRKAALNGDVLEIYLRRRIESFAATDPFRGVIDDPDLIDQLLEDVMATREKQTLRTPFG